jgi:ATP synthase F1 delta subunit
MNMHHLRLAKKYACAFIALYGDQITWESLECFKRFNIFINEHKEALFYAQLSELDGQVVKKAFYKVIQDFKLNQGAEKLVDLLVSHRRIFLIREIIAYIINLMKERLNIMEFTLESSHVLSSQDRESIIQFLSRSTGKQIVYKTKINRRLIAGIQLYSDTFGWEFSVRKQLEALSRVS